MASSMACRSACPSELLASTCCRRKMAGFGGFHSFGQPLMKEEIAELRPPVLIQTDNLSVEYGLSTKRQSQSLAPSARVEGISLLRD
jgi:hypothetical protein